MKRLYKIIIFFILIFLVGIFFAVKSINNTFTSTTKTEVAIVKPSLTKLVATVLY